jgi:alpha-tubulin suppressor-like RCC1 family protein
MRLRNAALTPIVSAGLFFTAVSGASATSSNAEHWGTFFGNCGDTGGGCGAKVDTLLSPTPVSLPSTPVQVATSNSTEYALLSNGSVYAWGLGSQGQLGDDGSANSLSVAVEVTFPPGVRIADLPTDAMPFDTAMAIDTTGHVWGWGYNAAGQLCLGDRKERLTPVELPLSGVTLAAGAGDHAIYAANGGVMACGLNGFGDLGDGNTRASATPVEVEGLAGADVEALVASYRDSGALLANGNYLDWGYNQDGQLGDGTTGTDSDDPVEVPLPLPVTEVAQGGSNSGNGQTIVMLSDGTLRAWGNDKYGQLGDQGTKNQAAPITIYPPVGVTYSSLASGGADSLAISSDGDLYGWGNSEYGQLGDGTTNTELQPVLIESGVSAVSATALNVATIP